MKRRTSVRLYACNVDHVDYVGHVVELIGPQQVSLALDYAVNIRHIVPTGRGDRLGPRCVAHLSLERRASACVFSACPSR